MAIEAGLIAKLLKFFRKRKLTLYNYALKNKGIDPETDTIKMDWIKERIAEFDAKEKLTSAERILRRQMQYEMYKQIAGIEELK